MTILGEADERARRWLLYVCFVASGAAGLILEIVWSKYLSLLLGNSIYGVSTVVAAFLGGLGIGAWWGGRIAGRVREPLLIYARLEAVVGCLGLISPLLFLLAKPVFAGLYGAMGGSGPVFLVVRFLILFGALLPPTIAMGASLPLLAADFTRRGSGFSASVGRLYAFNTAGAVLGTAGAGFLLVPFLGLWKTAVLASFLDFGVAVAVMLGRAGAPPKGIPEAGATVERGARQWIVPIFAVSGFTAILYEVAWTRILCVPLGGMVYALSAILTIYLLGLAVGSAVAARILRTARAPVVLFGIGQILLATLVGIGGHIFGLIPGWQASLVISSLSHPWRLALGELGIVALVVLPPTLVLGALFPLAATIYRGARRDPGASVGGIYAANTLGSIAGSVLTGFFLVPALGALGSCLAAATVNLAIGIAALLVGEGRPGRRRAGAAIVALAGVLFAVFALPAWPAQRMSIGFTRMLRAFRFGGEARGAQVARNLVETSGTPQGLEKLLFYKEGRLASVAVIESPGRKGLIVNGKPDATTGSGEDMLTQVMVAQIPLILAPQTKDVCIVGYGSGVTTHAVLTHPVREAVTLEIEEAVIDAAPLFREDAFEPLSDPRSRLVIEDAGTFLRSTGKRFDLVISEPSNPWLAGVGDLFTMEFYRAAAARLRPGGLFCQWVQCYEASPATLGTILRTLAGQFPHGHVFFFRPSNDLVVIASPDREVVLDPVVMKGAFERAEVARDFSRVGIQSAADLLLYYRGRLERLAREAGPGPVNTDDNGWLEHRAPLDLVLQLDAREAFGWSGGAASDLAGALGPDPDRSAGLLVEGVNRAVALGDPASARAFVSALQALGRPEAAQVLPSLATLDRRVAAAGEAARILQDVLPVLQLATQKGDADLGGKAVMMLSQAARLDPSSGEIAWRLGTALIAARRTEDAIQELRRAIELLPVTRRFPVRRELAVASFFRLDLAGCLREIEEMDRLQPGSAEAHYWRARVYMQQGDTPRAREEIRLGLAGYPDSQRLNQLRAELK